jgi:YNFM family putative membrane transporter
MTTINLPAAPRPALERGTAGYRRLGAAMWCAGLATFVLVYSVQALLPTLATEFAISSSTSSLVLSATTLTLALAVVPLSAAAESWGRARTMTAALGLSALLMAAAPLAPTFGTLVAIRAVQGVVLAALPAVAVAHVTSEVAPRVLGGAVGLLIAGNTVGGLSGRVIAGFVADVAGWRVGLAVIGGVSLLCTVAFRMLLPPSVPADRPRVAVRALGGPVRLLLADPGLRALVVLGFLLMGTFVSVYNYLGFRLVAPPFGVPAGLVGLVFLGYLAGTVSSPVAGTLADRFGRRRVLWAAVAVGVAGAWVSLPDDLIAVCAGLLLLTVGFFAAHSVASSWVGRRSSLLPGGSPALASSLYLLASYTGSSVGGSLGGVAYDGLGWPGLVGFVTVMLVLALLVALRLRRIPART